MFELINHCFKFGILIWTFKEAYFIFSEKIQELFAVGVVDSMTKLVLVNATYFKGMWQKKFMTLDITDAPFRLSKVK